MRNSCAVSLTRAKFDCSRSKRKTERIICVASESSSVRADSLPPFRFRFRFHIVCGRWWRYEGSVIAIINRAGVQRCRSTSRAIVSREQWQDRSHPRRRSIFIESSPAPPSLFPLTARFYRRYSTWCGKRFGTRLDRCSNEQRVGSGAVGVSPLENTLLSRWGRPETHQSRSPTLQMASDASTLSGPGLL